MVLFPYFCCVHEACSAKKKKSDLHVVIGLSYEDVLQHTEMQ